MELKVSFTRTPGYATQVVPRYLGLDDVDRIRQETKVQNLSLDRVYSITNSVEINPIVEIPEEIARVSRHFSDRQTVRVWCAKKQLNEFVTSHVVADRNAESGEIVNAKIVYSVDEDVLIAAWATAGYPLKWGE